MNHEFTHYHEIDDDCVNKKITNEEINKFKSIMQSKLLKFEIITACKMKEIPVNAKKVFRKRKQFLSKEKKESSKRE